MARTLLPNAQAVTLQPTGPATSTQLNLTLTAADVANQNYFVASGRDIVDIYNSDTVTHNLSVLSAPDACTGRKSDIVNYVIPAATDSQTKGHISFIVLPGSVFTQTDGTVQLGADNVAVYFNVRSL